MGLVRATFWISTLLLVACHTGGPDTLRNFTTFECKATYQGAGCVLNITEHPPAPKCPTICECK
jgi:hypothetical protein